ncbi:unnamed protein product, partial [Rotaria socialis]
KAAKPRCFKNLSMKQLPVIWRWNRTTWMTASLFGEWLASINNSMIKQNRQQLVKHVILTCAIANSSDDIVITALDAAHWTKNGWQAVTQSTICNTFRMTGFVNPNTQHETSVTMVNNSDDDVATALQDLDTHLTHITIGGLSLIANEFIEIDSETPVFNEWNDINDNLMVVDADCGGNITTDNNEDDDMPTEAPPKLIEAMYMVRRLHILAATQQPQLHTLISQLDSQLTQLFIDSKGVK